MTIPDPQSGPTRDQQGASLLAMSGLGLIPWVGGAIQPLVEAAITKGQRDLMQQFLEEVAAALRRHEQRIGHVELAGFLARREAAAALNSALGLAGKTASKEKHRLLANALINGASAPPEDEPLLPLFWSLVERHSALDVKLLHYLSNPLNLAIKAGYEFDKDPIWAECLFHVIPEMRYATMVRDQWGSVERIRSEDDEVEGEWWNEPEHDVTQPLDPYFLFSHSAHRLHDDQLIDLGDLRDIESYLRFYDEATLAVGDNARNSDGLYPGRPFESLSELGARYLAFLTAPDDEAGLRL